MLAKLEEEAQTTCNDVHIYFAQKDHFFVGAPL